MTLDDFDVIDRALEPAPGDRVVCVASAGDTPLNLLRFDPSEVVALDISAPQIYLTRLKLAAARALELSEYRRLLGFTTAGPAEPIYRVVRDRLDEPTRGFWDAHQDLLRRGLMWQGSVLRMGAFWGPLARAGNQLLRRYPRLELNPYLAPLLLGRLAPEEFLPPYLRAASYPAVQRNIDHISVIHEDLRTYLRRRPSRSVDSFALSNVMDWLPRREVPAFLLDVARVATPGARVLLCARRRGGELPSSLAGVLVPDQVLQRELHQMDRIGYFRSITLLRAR